MHTNPLWPEFGPDHSCSSCAWLYKGGRGRPVLRCRRHLDKRVDPDWPACPAWTAPLDCLDCGACCRHAYHTVEVSSRDPFCRRHPELLVRIDKRLNIARKGPNCACLEARENQWFCTVYEARPKTCREFERGGKNCIDARRRIGLTP